MKIVMPVYDILGERLSGHFGRAPYFAWFDVQSGKVIDQGVVPNDSSHFGGKGNPPERIARLEPNVVITLGMGMRAIKIFQGMGVAVLQGKGKTTTENITSFIDEKLTELTEGCLHAHDH